MLIDKMKMLDNRFLFLHPAGVFKARHLLVLAASMCGFFLNADTTVAQFSLCGKNISRIHFSEIGSTQVFSREKVKVNPLGLNNWILVTTDKQGAGVGSHSRKWISHVPGNVYATLNFPITVDDSANVFERIRNVFSLAVLETMKDFLPNNEISYKWPNDVLVNGKKISGVLCEYKTLEPNVYHAIVGIGINVNLSREILDKIDQPATSMALEGGVDLSVDKIMEHVIRKAIEFELEDASSIKDELQKHFSLLGQEVQVHDDATSEDICGILSGIGEDGSLLLNVGGKIRSILNGTVVKK